MYDALNVLSAMDIIRKDKYNIIYNHYNEHIPSDFGLEWSDSDDVDGVSGSPAKGEVAPGASGKNPESAKVAGPGEHGFSLTLEMVEQREQEVADTRKRIRDKQKLFLELIKQQVSITKLKHRNIEVANTLLNDSNGFNVDKSAAHSAQKLQLPLLFVEC